MKKILSLLLAIILLSACDKGYKEYDTSQPNEQKAQEEQETIAIEEPALIEEPQTTPSAPTINSDDKYIFKNFYGDDVDIREARDISISGENGFGSVSLSPDEALEQEFFVVEFNDYTYMTNSIGVSYNSITDDYDDKNRIFNADVPERDYKNFKVYIGDKFGSLTVKEVLTGCEGGKEYDLYVRDNGIVFSGSVELTGYIASTYKDDLMGTGAIVFFPDAESWGALPIYFRGSRPPERTATIGEFNYSSDIMWINLGDIFKDYDNVDLDVIPQDGSFVRATVTITDLELYYCLSGARDGNFGRIVSVELID